MKNPRFLIPILFAGLIPTLGWAASEPPPQTMQASPEPPVSSRLPFAPGEELRFAVKYGVVRAGDAVMSVEEVPGLSETAYRFVSTAQSSRFFSTFYRVNDRVESVWSTERRLPIRFEKRIREGKYKKDVAIRFDHGAGVAVYKDGKQQEILPGSQDVLSSFYLVRSQPLRVGEVIDVPNHSDGKNYPLQVRVLRKENVEVAGGKFRCVVIEPLLRSAGLFKQEGRLTIWLTDDSRRMPVLMKSKVAVGSIVAELESFRLGRPPSWKGSARPQANAAAKGDP